MSIRRDLKGVSMLSSFRLSRVLAVTVALAGVAPATAAAGVHVDEDTLLSRPADPASKRPVARASIVDGTPIDIAATPWMASVQDRTQSNFHICGGALVHPRVVLTAAHCVANELASDKPAQNLQVVLGRTDLRTSGGEVHDVVGIVKNPRWDPKTSSGDSALLVLGRPAAAPVLKLADATTRLRAGVRATAMGWGQTQPEDPSSASPQLLATQVPLLAAATCRRAWADYDTATMVCAGWPQGGHNTCSGDSGGPLVVRDDKGELREVGIVSYGAKRCAVAGAPTVFSSTGAQSTQRMLTATIAALGDGPRTGDPRPAPAPTPAPSGDRTAPQIRGLSVRLVRHGSRFKAQVRFRVSERARLLLVVGRRVNGRYVPASRPAALRPGAGRHRLRLSGRLRPGSYLLAIRATDAAGNATTAGARFRLGR